MLIFPPPPIVHMGFILTTRESPLCKLFVEKEARAKVFNCYYLLMVQRRVDCSQLPHAASSNLEYIRVQRL